MKRIDDETVKKIWLTKAYLEVWRLQNNPEYLRLWKDFEASGSRLTIDIARRCKKFNLKSPLNPTPKIAWERIYDKDFEHSILDKYFKKRIGRFSPVFLLLGDELPSFPTGVLVFEPDLPKELFLRYAEQAFDRWREIMNIQRTTREHWLRIPHYCLVFDKIFGPPPRSFRAVARELKKPTSTVVSQYKKAYELLFAKTPRLKPIKLLEEKLQKCDRCANQTCLNTGRLCRDMEIYLGLHEKAKDWVVGAERFDRIANQYSFSRWLNP